MSLPELTTTDDFHTDAMFTTLLSCIRIRWYPSSIRSYDGIVACSLARSYSFSLETFIPFVRRNYADDSTALDHPLADAVVENVPQHLQRSPVRQVSAASVA